jgi:ribosome-associated toxin RatA of RatAB toxin-antitoxin module
MKTKQPLIMALISIALLTVSANTELPPPPAEASAEYGFSELDEDTIETLVEQSCLIIVRQRPDMTPTHVTAGRLVDAPIEVVRKTVEDIDRYEEFMPQTEDLSIIEDLGDNKYLIEQVIALKIWRLPSINMTNRMVYQLKSPDIIRFWHADGPMEGTYGGWDLVKLGDQTIIFFTYYADLTALGWGLGSIFKSEPEFMASINVTTAMMVTKGVKEECEK